MLTPDSIRESSRISGYDHVGKNLPGRKPYQADVYGGKNDKAGRQWKGPRRLTALEAAQDYCDYMNGKNIPVPATLKTAGHEYVIDEADNDPEYQAALGVMRDRRAQREGKQGYVYLITEHFDGGALRYVKIGYSVNPRKRVAELQTGNPRKLILLYAMPGTEEDERRLHTKYIKANVMQEWFRVTPELICEFPVDTKISPAGD